MTQGASFANQTTRVFANGAPQDFTFMMGNVKVHALLAGQLTKKAPHANFTQSMI